MRMLGVSAALVAALIVVAEGQTPPDLSSVLEAVATYVADYERQISAVVSEETYVQRANPGSGVRHLKSDLLVINHAAVGWVAFRDVFEVDGAPVRDREERLKKLFLEGAGDAFEQAMRISRESARYNLVAEIQRTVNTPFQALLFVSRDRQQRSHFKIEGVRTIGGVRAVVLKFDEFEKPRIIQTTDGAPARGRFWIDPESGRVLRSELQIETSSNGWSALSGSVGPRVLTASVRATYEFVDKLKLWMPVAMDEEYRVGATLVEGHATYANFRRFSVDINTTIK